MQDILKEPTQQKMSLKQIGILSLLIVLAAQVNLDVFTNNFLVSIGILLFPVFVYLFQEIPLIPITPYFDLRHPIRLSHRQCHQSFSGIFLLPDVWHCFLFLF